MIETVSIIAIFIGKKPMAGARPALRDLKTGHSAAMFASLAAFASPRGTTPWASSV
jgi:hypothetical protein